MDKNTEDGKEYDSMNMPIHLVKTHIHINENNRGSLCVSIKTLEELAAEYKIPHYLTLAKGEDLAQDDPIIWKHFTYLPDGCYVFAETVDPD